RGFLVQTVRQLQKAGLGAGGTHLFDHAKRHAAAAVDGDARWFIDHNQGLILENNGKLSGGDRPFFIGLRDPQGRNADFITLFDPVFSLDPTLVYTHLPTSDGLVQMALGNSLTLADQEIIDALTVGSGVCTDQPYRKSGFFIRSLFAHTQ